MNAAAFRALLLKDLRLFARDPRGIIMTFVAPILIGSFIGYVTGGMSGQRETARIRLLVADPEQSEISRSLVAKLSAEKQLEVVAAREELAREQVRQGKAPAALVIPAGFGDAASRALFTAGAKPKLALYSDPSKDIEAGMIKGMLTGYAMEAVTGAAFGGGGAMKSVAADGLRAIESSPLPADQRKALRSILEGMDQLEPGSMAASGGGGGLRVPFELDEQKLTARSGVRYNAYAHSFAGMAVQFILFLAIDVGVGLLLARRQGLWRRLRSAPLSKATLLSSRVASAALIAVLVMIVTFGFARAVFDVKIEGSLAGFLVIAVAFGLMSAAYGLLIAALGNTPDAARGLSILVTLVMVMLSGAWMPAFLFPPWLQKISAVTPARWAVDGFDNMTWRGLGFADALPAAGALLGFAMLFAVIAVMRFRWEE